MQPYVTTFKLPFNFTVPPPPGCTLSEKFRQFLSSLILLTTGKTRKIAIGVSVGAVMLIALVASIVCFVRRRKARALSNQLTTVNARNTSSDTTPLTRANAGNTGMLPQWKREIIQEIPVLLPQEQSLLHPMGHKLHLYPLRQQGNIQ